MLKKILTITIDVITAGLIILGIWVYNYIIPHQYVYAQAPIKTQNITADNYETENTETLNYTADDWHIKFANKFTDTIISTKNSYTSPNLSIHIAKNNYDTNRFDSSEKGTHTKYGTSISYVLADIYIGDISCFQTAFAQNTYGVGYSELLTDMSDKMKSVLAVNGDSYNNNRHQDSGTIIRNGLVYRTEKTDMETCALLKDGTMKIYQPNEQLVADDTYQSWIFGPSLLDSNGKANTNFLTWDYIKESHPRTAIGYYEPGHYCLLVVDGRQKNYSRGMFLDEMAQLFENLGCTVAYNLDGGHCSAMTFGSDFFSQPYKSNHTIPDGIFITDKIAK